MKKLNRKNWIVQRLRRMSLKWPPRNNVKKANRREYYKTKKDGSKFSKPNFEYQCNICKKWLPDSQIQLDHINPVVDPEDSNLYTEEEFIGKFAISLLCYEDNYQIACINCHKMKTKKENKNRKKT
jgi:5-methylcytosine-specific restriction endonuclease McrA